MIYKQGIDLTRTDTAAREGAAKLLRAAAQIRAQAAGERPTRPSADLTVRRYNLIRAMHMYRQRFGRGVADEG